MAETVRYPGVKLRTFRASDEVWLRGKAAARLRGETFSEVLRDLIEEYIAETEREYGPVRADDADRPVPRRKRLRSVGRGAYASGSPASES